MHGGPTPREVAAWAGDLMDDGEALPAPPRIRAPAEPVRMLYPLGALAFGGALIGIASMAPPAMASLCTEALATTPGIVRYLVEPREAVEGTDRAGRDQPSGATDGTGRSADGDGEPAAHSERAEAATERRERPARAASARRSQTSGATDGTGETTTGVTEAPQSGVLTTLAALHDAWRAPASPYDEPLQGSAAVAALFAEPRTGIEATGLQMHGRGRGTLTTHGGGGYGTICGGCELGLVRGSISGFATRAPEVRLPGRGMLSRRTRVPIIRTCGGDCGLRIRGTLAAAVVRAHVRRHLPEVRHCYEQSLIERPDLEGRVVSTFIIGADGYVVASVISSSTLGSAPVEQCIAQSVRRWIFPATEDGGVVAVNYPFVLATAGE